MMSRESLLKKTQNLSLPVRLCAFWVALALLTPGWCWSAELKPNALFSKGAVLQQGTPIPVWGTGSPGENVRVTINGISAESPVDPTGKWQCKIPTLQAGGAFVMKVESGGKTIVIEDVYVGEVWLCSGQSNMQMRIGATADAEKEKAAANYPLIRMFEEKSGVSTVATDQPNGAWVAATPVTAHHMSAVAYFFGRELHQKLGVPIGLINSSLGGTPIQAWTSFQTCKDNPAFEEVITRFARQQADWDSGKTMADYEVQMAAYKNAPPPEPEATPKPEPRKPTEPRLSSHYPGNFFNSKINPLVPYAIRGAIWYQGESNAGSPAGCKIYGDQLRAMVGEWRRIWGQGDFPFAWVQLPNYVPPQPGPNGISNWAIIRESMREALDILNSGMVVTIDVGEANDIHPKDKRPVAKRLAAWALAKVYGQPGAFSGPLVRKVLPDAGKVVVEFDHTDGGLVTKGGELKGFSIAGNDRQWKPARAEIVGERVVVSSPGVPEPVAVRYAWADNPECNLYNGADLPASPFRSDHWEIK